MSKQCITHHYACDCREEEFAKMEQDNKRLREALEYAQKRLAKQGQEYEIIDNALGQLSTSGELIMYRKRACLRCGRELPKDAHELRRYCDKYCRTGRKKRTKPTLSEK